MREETGSAQAAGSDDIIDLQSSDQRTGGEGHIANDEKVAETIYTSEMAIKNLNYECGHIINHSGELLHVEHGKAHSVNPPVELIKDNIFTHNHPSGGCMLTVSDIRETIKRDGYEVRAVTRDGRFVSFKKGTGALNPAIVDDMTRARLSGEKLLLDADKQAIARYGKGRTDAQIMQEKEHIVNAWMISNASRYGYIFTQGVI